MRKITGKYGRYILYIAVICLVAFLWFWTDLTPRQKGTVKVYDRNNILLFESSGNLGRQEVVTLDKIPKELIDAVIITEDERFYKHPGVDPIAILRAVFQNVSSGEIISGASTIPQQLARFTVISPQTPAKLSVIRKIKESLMAIRLSFSVSKNKVLEDYLNNMHFGRSNFGVQSASRLYFGKDVSTLSLAQAATLAGMIANPSKYDPVLHPETAMIRRNGILKKMYQKKLIETENYERALEEPLPTKLTEVEYNAPHAVELAISEVEKLELSGDDGYSIYTTIDLGWYKLTKRIASQKVEQLKIVHDLTNAAVVILENDTGRILSLLGSVDYFDENIQGKNNMALALRQPGSSIKPITYAASFQEEIATPGTPIDDFPKVYLTKKGEGFLPHNYDGQYRGRVLVREALASSYNLPAVEMLERVGIENFLNLAHQMGITSMKDVERYDLALTLGGGEVNLLELTNMYATFARGGKWIPTQLVAKVTDNEGKIIYLADTSVFRAVLDEEVAWLVTDILSDKKARIPTFGEKNALSLSKPAAVKTGTTTDWHDNWTVGYTPDYTVGVWVGNSDNRPMREISGITGAAPIWNGIFEELLKFSDSREFVKPEGISEVEICAWDGLLPGDACAERYWESFIKGTEPIEVSTLKLKPEYKSGVVQIINPKQGAIYEIGAVNNETIVFETSKRGEPGSLEWILDGEEITCQGRTENSCSWHPVVGEHILSVNLLEGDDKTLLAPVNFKVLEYKQGW